MIYQQIAQKIKVRYVYDLLIYRLSLWPKNGQFYAF